LIVSPATGGLLNVGVAPSTKSMDIVWLAITVTDTSLEVTPLPKAVAVLVIEPALMSARVIVRVEVQVIDAPGASEPVGHETVGCLSSLTLNGPASVVFPLFEIV